MSDGQLTLLLTQLGRSGVDFILVGGLAAVAQGAPVTTFDVDIVHARDADNVARLVAFLEGINARYRGRPANAPLGPSADALRTTGHSLFTTDLGPLDALGSIEEGKLYEDLLPSVVEVELDGVTIRVLRLDVLVALKRQSTAPKDLQKLAVLERVLKLPDEPAD